MDYSEWLGPDYEKDSKFGTIVSNHTTYMDPVIHVMLYSTVMVSKGGVSQVPLIGKAAKGLETIFVYRDSAESKHKTIEDIKKRQEEALADEHSPVGIYPEGTVTNGKGMIPFKAGAFLSMTPVKPVYFKYTGKFDSCYCSIEIPESLIILLS